MKSISLRASSRARGLGFCWGEGVGGGKGTRACSDVSWIWMPPLILPTASCWQSCQNLTNQHQAGNEFNVNNHVTSVSRRESCWEKLKTGILLRKTLHFFIDFVHHAPQKQENNSERFNFIVSTLNGVNPKFVQPIDSQESNSDINTNKTVARLVWPIFNKGNITI